MREITVEVIFGNGSTVELGKRLRPENCEFCDEENKFHIKMEVRPKFMVCIIRKKRFGIVRHLFSDHKEKP